MIISLAPNNGMGSTENGLLYKDSDDMSVFKKYTTNEVVLMGPNTEKSLPSPLKNRINLVWTKYNSDDIKVVVSQDTILNPTLPSDYFIHCEKPSIEALKYLLMRENRDIWVIGGAKTISMFKDYINFAIIDRFYTHPKSTVGSFFDTRDLSNLTLIKTMQHETFQTEVWIDLKRLYDTVFWLGNEKKFPSNDSLEDIYKRMCDLKLLIEIKKTVPYLQYLPFYDEITPPLLNEIRELIEPFNLDIKFSEYRKKMSIYIEEHSSKNRGLSVDDINLDQDHSENLQDLLKDIKPCRFSELGAGSYFVYEMSENDHRLCIVNSTLSGRTTGTATDLNGRTIRLKPKDNVTPILYNDYSTFVKVLIAISEERNNNIG